jgi:hypothetical protein
MLSLGTERLVGTRYGPNVPLAFDGVRAIVTHGQAQLSLLAVKPVVARPGNFDDRTSPTKALWGAYATVPGLDLYYLGYRNRDARFGGHPAANGATRSARGSHGARAAGTGTSRASTSSAILRGGRSPPGRWAASGRAVPLGRLSPDVTVRFNVVSGDRNPRDNHLGTFNALFPKGKYFGELSPWGRPTSSASIPGSARRWARAGPPASPPWPIGATRPAMASTFPAT